MNKIVLLLIAIYIVMGISGFFETADEKEIRDYEQKRNEILNRETSTEIDKFNRLEDLRELARKIGAGADHTVIGPSYKYPSNEHGIITPRSDISESELVNNINIALQTKSAISSLKQTTKTIRIAFIAVLVAIFSSLYPNYKQKTKPLDK